MSVQLATVPGVIRSGPEITRTAVGGHGGSAGPSSKLKVINSILFFYGN